MTIHPKVNCEYCCPNEFIAQIKLKKCCCCIPLRAGCIIISILGIIGAFGILGIDRGSVGIGIALNGWIANGCLLFGSWKQMKQPLMAYLIIELVQIVNLIFAPVYFFARLIYIDQTRGCYEPNELCRMSVLAGFGAWPIACTYVHFWICVLSLFNRLNVSPSNHPV